ncbi:putative transporter [Podospora aff. communis PSN243]|uniref:Transporter n=1 Tax=Podospora aff. communis PSN243 TaxID=3040156 RepID=A0AAV9G9U5_9PEZI|nr:putative transporter [Podospora aff. communis PSN243]
MATTEQSQLGIGESKSPDTINVEVSVSVKRFDRSKRFWAIIATLSVAALLSSLENSVVTTALPFIVNQLSLGADYIWVTNVFFLTAAAVQPLFGQLANIWGRRSVTLVIVAFFTLGSGICGGATNGAMLIAGRAVQGVGSGGMNVIVDIIISDLVPLRERGNYIAIVLAVYSVGVALGPWIGGVIVSNTSWRWVFYINLPVGGATLIMTYLFLRVNYNEEMALPERLRRIDYGGNVLIIGSTVSVLYALTYAGNLLPWSSPRVIAPLAIGLAGFVVFFWYENTPSLQDPVLPTRLFATRTSTIVFTTTFLNSAILYWMIFFLPVYFQAVLGSSPARAGVQLLPAVLVSIPGAIVAVILLSRFGRYKPLHLLGFAIQTLGLGLCILLDENSSTAEWVLSQGVGALGSGFVLNTLLPAAQAQMSEADQAATTAAWSFTRSFGSIWGVAIPAAIFANRFNELASNGGITDPAVRAEFEGGDGAYMHALAELVNSFSEPSRTEIISVYSRALKLVWQAGVAFSGLSFLLVFLEKEVKLRKELETEYGLEPEQEAGKGNVKMAKEFK